jgi:hypothetical protein
MRELISRIRPNILVAMLIVGILGAITMIIGYQMEAVEIVTGAGGMTTTGIIALAMKILEKD